MSDLVCMLLLLGFFGLTLWMILGLERLKNRGGG